MEEEIVRRTFGYADQKKVFESGPPRKLTLREKIVRWWWWNGLHVKYIISMAICIGFTIVLITGVMK